MIEEKIKTATILKKILSGLKRRNKKIVFTNGCFDILHPGHVKYLEKAKSKGDLLVVAVNSDDSAKRVKGKGRPIVRCKARMKVLAALESVDFVTWFKEDNPYSIVRKLAPDVLVNGADWREDEIIGAKFVKDKGGRVVTVPIIKGYSTTKILKKIKKL